ncbi:unnamed protein product, partial [Mesorhabditis belari]|uniref:Uncharacterized protein n=1 Tax=Mesorhabditis belari TaxID=2138241 RepID=A0AAF3EPI5_9BILA
MAIESRRRSRLSAIGRITLGIPNDSKGESVVIPKGSREEKADEKSGWGGGSLDEADPLEIESSGDWMMAERRTIG